MLEEIICHRKKEVESVKKKLPLKILIERCNRMSAPSSFLNAISVPEKVTIIAEMKKKSPSAGTILKSYSPSKISGLYEKCGASALSVLTEKKYFGGSPEDILKAEKGSGLPVLRKDFIFDPYQIFETKTLGASAVLLIIAILKPEIYSSLFKLTRDLKMDVLVEVHSEKELEIALKESPEIIGINNRNLKTLKTELGTTFALIKKIPGNVCVVSESGIKTPETVRELKSAGIRSALVGESILKSGNMAQQLKSLVEAGQE